MNSGECPICGVVDCGGVVYPHMVARYLAGRDREHWRRIHDRALATRAADATPEDLAIRAAAAKGSGCCH